MLKFVIYFNKMHMHQMMDELNELKKSYSHNYCKHRQLIISVLCYNFLNLSMWQYYFLFYVIA